MIIRKAKLTDIDRLSELLYVVHNLHAEGRPDIFTKGKQKYTKEKERYGENPYLSFSFSVMPK